MQAERQLDLAGLASRGTVASSVPSRQPPPSWPKRMRSPTASRLAGRAKARQRLSSTRLCRLKRRSARGSRRAAARPYSAARDHARIVEDERVARPQQVRQIAHDTVLEIGVIPRAAAASTGCTTSSRAASRGSAGCSAMALSGRSKSKRSVRIAPNQRFSAQRLQPRRSTCEARQRSSQLAISSCADADRARASGTRHAAKRVQRVRREQRCRRRASSCRRACEPNALDLRGLEVHIGLTHADAATASWSTSTHVARRASNCRRRLHSATPRHPQAAHARRARAVRRAFVVDLLRITRRPPRRDLDDLVGVAHGSPRLILSTFSMPSITLPQTVYCLSRKRASSKQMKNWLLALLGFCERAIEQTPRTCGSALNSAGRFGYFEPPVPVPCGQPVCAMKPSMTRWKTMPS